MTPTGRCTRPTPAPRRGCRRLSLLGPAHINMLGRYAFTPPAPGAGLRPLRDPDQPEHD
jgi:hypothetical protein